MGFNPDQVVAAASVPASERTEVQREAVASDPNRQAVLNAGHAAELKKKRGIK